MKRVGDLWDKLVSFENLHAALQRAARGKRRRRDVAAFLLNTETGLVTLRRELMEGSYRPGEYRTFLVQDGKPRTISAAPFRDRVVHHALTGILEPIWERRFSPNNFACRKGLGTHAALARAGEGARKHEYVLQCDVRKYFASMDHAILKEKLARGIKCQRTLDLAGTIIDGSNEQEPVEWYFPGDDLFTPYERRRGLPLGNQTSQFFANVYLDELDQLADRVWKTGVYVRYVDDLLFFGDGKERLRALRGEIVEVMQRMRLRIHSGKSRIYRVDDGFTFLGWRHFPAYRRLARENVTRFVSRMRGVQRAWGAGAIELAMIKGRVRAWIAHAEHGATWRLRQELLERFAFHSGCAAANTV